MHFKLRKFYQGVVFYPVGLIILIFTFTSVNAQSSIEKGLNLSEGHQSIKNILAEIEAQTDYSFIYSSSLIATDQKVKISPFRNTGLFAIFKQIEEQTTLKFEMEGKQVRIVPLGVGQVSGKVTDVHRTPLELASISVLQTGIGTTTAADGSFRLHDVPEGIQELEFRSVGYLPVTIKVNVQKDKNIDLKNILLNEDIRQLDQVEVSDRSDNGINNFADKKTEYVARMPLSNLENPQVYNVISGELIRQQVTFTVQDAIRNAPGAVPVVSPSGELSTHFRGFQVGINSRNGMESTLERSGVDIANVERIEVLKGPSATLFGSAVSSFGGVINLVTKKPQINKQTSLSYTTGSFGLNRLTADINTPLNPDKSVLLRINSALNRQQSYLDFGFNHTFMIAPSLSYTVNDRLNFLLDMEYLKVNNTQPMNFIINSPELLRPSDIKLDFRSTLYHENADVKNYSTRLFGQAEYKLSKTFKSTTVFSYVTENVDYSYQRPVVWTDPTSAMRGISIYGPVYNGYTNLQENINGEFATGRINHKILVGANLQFYSGKFLFSDFRIIDEIDLNKGYTPLTKQELDEGASFMDYPTAKQSTTSIYATDVLKFGERISLMVALRLDHFKREALEAEGGEGFSQTSLAPKLGAVYELVPEKLSLFANYMSGFQNEAPVIQPNGSRLILDPVFANQAEGGVKLELLERRLNFTVSYYDIYIDNAVRTDENEFTVQDGSQKSKGIDLEVIAEPFRGLSIVAGYAYNDNRIIKASNESIEGNKASNSPENVANFWLSYSFFNRLKGFGLGFGANHVDQLYRTTANTFYIPSYTLINAAVQYQRDQWGIQLKANNLSNLHYWDRYGNAQSPANFAANLSLRF